jgi:pimeloyl-ACP methyl ester carboxylesterase
MTTATSATPKGQTVKANGIDMYYEEVGSGRPLLLLHGGTGTGSSWRDHLTAFETRFRVIMPDSRGHGRTNNPSGSLSYRVMADDFVAFAQALGLTKPLIFGYSDGGQTALEIGMHYPDFAAALAIGGATYHFSPTYYEAVNAFSFLTNGVVDIAALERDEPDWAEALKADHARPDDPDKWKTLLDHIASLWLTPLTYTLDDLRKITTPALILVGDRDAGVSVEQAVAMYRTIPTADLAILPHADHGSAGWLESGPNPLFADSVLPFLMRHAAAGS